ncbi:uncharacterized protein B0H64DRAFT_370485 [Chaetomium fimeti]|uniref:DUF1365-domain-containing protein n=1 Tax=Chaetomium fimeti TaxID=1854472 RepID=A0AAE0LXT0_9PEZI|nr:hypothetical protein B0H64DRAFT_370485 [Chaetomium fimeti]
MATPSATPLVTILMTISSTIFSSPINAAMAASFLAIWQTRLFVDLPGLVSLRGTLLTAISTSAFAFLLFKLLRTKGAKVKAPRWDGPGKVLLFPCWTSHSRLFPKKHSFSYPYLLVGIPVGFEGSVGWFTIDAGDYLERGKSELGLRGKLDEYLWSQGVNPTIYPSAYLITAPRFLGYQFNPVSFWYLYDADQRLAAMILEVNNTFSERRMYYLTAGHGLEDQIDCSPDHNTHQPTFKNTWPKDFHVSPFNSRNGSYSLSASDPLNPSTQDAPTLTTTITLLSSQNPPKPKMIATLTSTTAPLNPHTLPPSQKYHLLLTWCLTPLLTYPRILAQAATLSLRHQLPIWAHPHPHPHPQPRGGGGGTLSRPATRAERHLEAVFRRYLAWLVEARCASPLVVRYVPAGVVPVPEGGGGGCVLRSPAAAAAGVGLTVVEEVEVRVLTPAFYGRFAAGYAGTLEGLVGEGGEGGTVWVSRPDLLAWFVPEEKGAAGLPEVLGLGEDVPFRVLQYLRGGKGFGMSGMDAYVLECEDERERGMYKGHVLRALLAERIPFGSVALLEAVWLMVRMNHEIIITWSVLVLTCYPSNEVYASLMIQAWAHQGNSKYSTGATVVQRVGPGKEGQSYRLSALGLIFRKPTATGLLLQSNSQEREELIGIPMSSQGHHQ